MTERFWLVRAGQSVGAALTSAARAVSASVTALGRWLGHILVGLLLFGIPVAAIVAVFLVRQTQDPFTEKTGIAVALSILLAEVGILVLYIVGRLAKRQRRT